MRQRITNILPTPDDLQGKGIRDLPNERAISRPQDKKRDQPYAATDRHRRAFPRKKRHARDIPPKKRHADVLAFHAADSDPKRPVFRQTKQRRRPAGSAAPQRLPRHDPKYPSAHGYPRFSLIYAPASLYKTDYIPHHGKRTVRTAETEPRYIHPTLSVICRTPDKIQNQTYEKSSGVRIRRRCLSISRLQKTGLSLHPVRPAYGQATSRAHRRRSAGRRSWRPTRR